MCSLVVAAVPCMYVCIHAVQTLTHSPCVPCPLSHTLSCLRAAATVLPLILYDPRWQVDLSDPTADPGDVMASDRDGHGPFSWSFCGRNGDCFARVDPTQTCVWIVCLLVFGCALLQAALKG